MPRIPNHVHENNQIDKKMAHSKLGASSMYRWSACPGSVKASEGIKSKSSSYAEEGTMAHDLAEKVINAYISEDTELQKQVRGEIAKADLPEDMLPAIEVYFNYLKDVLIYDNYRGSNGKTKLYVEKRFDLSDVYPGCFGTADFVCYNALKKHLWVVDYKHGAGLPVEVEGNPQLKYYALGAMLNLNKPVANVTVVVVQPRCDHADGPIREHTYGVFEILDFSADLIEFAKATEDPNAPLVPGDHCRFCPALHSCPEISKQALANAQEAFKAEGDLINGKPVSEILEWLPKFEAWIKRVREYAYQEAVSGRPPKGFKLVEKRATRKYADPEAAFNYMALVLPKEEISVRKVLTPAQMEKVIKAELGKDFLKDFENKFVTKVSSGLTLVSDSDKRQEVKKDAASVFGKLEE